MKTHYWFGVAVLFVLGAILFFRSEFFLSRVAMPPEQSGETALLHADQEIDEGIKPAIYMVEGKGESWEGIRKQVEYAARYAKLELNIISPGQIADIPANPYTGMILAGTAMNDLDIPALKAFVGEGGRLLVASSFEPSGEWAELLGIEQAGDYMSLQGLEFERELYPGYPDVAETEELFTHSSLEVTVKDTADVWIRAEQNPVFWVNAYGDGKVGMWNSSILSGKMTRGLMTQSLSVLFPAFVTAQAGTEVIFIDDFPSPVPAGTIEGSQLLKEPISVRDFYKHHWWKEMERLIGEYDIRLTSGTIATYEDQVHPPFKEMSDSIRQPYLYYGRSLLRHKGEIGYHGYNHQPLVLEETKVNPELGYHYWPDEKSMRLAVQQLKETVESFFPHHTIETYIPPSNIIDRTGIRVLAEELPELQTIASLYFGSSKDGSLIQEFEADPEYPQVFHFPRVTSGYFMDSVMQFQMADAMANVGVISHFIHPDDVLDDFRSNGSSWKELSEDYENVLKNARTWYPLLQSATQKDATASMKAYLGSEVSTAFTGDSVIVTCKGLPENALLSIRLEEGKKLEEGEFAEATVVKISDCLYSVRLKQGKAEFRILEEQL